MTVLFDVLLLECSREDSRTGRVSLVVLSALVGSAVGAGSGNAYTAALVVLPFLPAVARGCAGSGDILGVLAVGVRFEFVQAFTVIVLACLAGAVTAFLSGRSTPGQTVPFFPCIALGIVLVRGLA